MITTKLKARLFGYSLVEVLVAISILLIAVIGPMTIAVKGIQSARYSKEQTVATFLAQEGIETIVAIRNEAMSTAIKNGDLSTAWGWVSDAKLSDCFSAAGCNFDVEGLTTANQFIINAIHPVQDCSSITDCILYYDSSSGRARYNANSRGVPTPFTRVISLQSDTTTNEGVIITSEVTWTSKLFGSSNRSVKLESAVYRIYE